MTYEGFRLKLRKKYINLTAKDRRNKINNDNFTIISNNCWGGTVYQSYGLKYNSPTIGLYFMSEDYIKFVYNIKEYLKKELIFIKSKDSKRFKNTNEIINYPIARLGDIEIYFMHYSSEKEAKEKWSRRCERINWNKILYKFSNQNGWEKEDIEKFLKLPVKNKICFINKKINIDGTIYIRQLQNTNDIKASYEPFGKSRKVDINKLINNL